MGSGMGLFLSFEMMDDRFYGVAIRGSQDVMVDGLHTFHHSVNVPSGFKSHVE
jgi:hypothetical protein